MKVKSESEVAQSCPTLRDPMDCSLPGSSVHGIFQAEATTNFYQVKSQGEKGKVEHLVCCHRYLSQGAKPNPPVHLVPHNQTVRLMAVPREVWMMLEV